MVIRLLLFLLLHSYNVNAAPFVVTSIKPIHSIISALTDNITETELLLNSGQDVHNFHLKPSQISLIAEADILISVDNKLESELDKVIDSVAQNKKIFVTDINGINILSGNEQSIKNYHLWLDINNMKIIAKNISTKLIKVDPENRLNYLINLSTLINSLEKLDKEITNKLSSHLNTAFATYSDTFQYFTESNKLEAPVVVTKYHGSRLSLHTALRARKEMQNKHIKCIISDKEVPIKRINTLTEGLNINNAQIDVMGLDIKRGPSHYFKLMNRITNKVIECLQ
jgi:zinc transport system substrate-binding protein